MLHAQNSSPVDLFCRNTIGLPQAGQRRKLLWISDTLNRFAEIDPPRHPPAGTSVVGRQV